MNRIVEKLALIGMAACTSQLIGCGPVNIPKPPPPRGCITADECWDIKPSVNRACGWSVESDVDRDAGKFGRVSGEMADRQFKIYGMHPTKDVLVTIKTTVETQLPQPPQESFIPLLLRAQPKGSVKGGRPDGIDTGGPDRFLGCEWVRDVELIQRYRFEVVKACFVDDPSCSTSPPYTKPEQRPPVDQELARCENACSGNDPAKCFKYPDVGGRVSSALYAIHRDLTQNTAPFGLDLTPLLTTLSGAGAKICDPRRLEVSAANDAVSSGPYCRVALATPSATPPNLQSVVLDLPNVIAGDFSTSGAGALAIAKIQFRSNNTAAFEFFSPGSSTPSTRDRLVAAYFGSTRLLLAGQAQFCAVIPYKGG